MDDWAEEADPPDSEEEAEDIILEGGSTEMAGTWEGRGA